MLNVLTVQKVKPQMAFVLGAHLHYYPQRNLALLCWNGRIMVGKAVFTFYAATVAHTHYLHGLAVFSF